MQAYKEPNKIPPQIWNKLWHFLWYLAQPVNIINNKSNTTEGKERAKRIKEFDEDKSQILEITKQLFNLGVDLKNISQKDRFEPETQKILNKYFSLKKAKSRRSIDKKKSKRNSKKQLII